MDISLFDFDLPPELIANRPIYPRNISRLLIGDTSIVHDNFNNILNYIKKDDLLIVNNSRVIPAYFSVKFEKPFASFLEKKGGMWFSVVGILIIIFVLFIYLILS